MVGVQAAEHWQLLTLHKGFAALQQAAQLKRTGQRILANFLGRRMRAAWNAWTEMVQVSCHSIGVAQAACFESML